MAERDDDFESLLERSSLGALDARKLRRGTPPGQAVLVRQIAELLGRSEHGEGRPYDDVKLVELLLQLGHRTQAAAVETESLTNQPKHDRLTGLLNRDALLAGGGQVVRDLVRYEHVALLALEINDFREVNETLGLDCGDEVLKLIAERLTDLARENELVARTGDHEFALLVPMITTLSGTSTPQRGAPSPLPPAVRRARDLVERLVEPMEVAGIQLAVEIAVGVAVAKVDPSGLDELLRRASVALGKTKQRRVAITAYDPDQETTTTDGLALLAELRDALLTDDQIVLALQPAVDLATGEPTGVEALVRWAHPRRGMLAPNDFLPTVEHGGLLTPFTARVIDLALAAAADWKAAGIDLPVSVNVSARSLLDPDFPAQLADTLYRHRMPASRLVLELTESVAVSQQAIVDEVVAALHELGVQLSLDNFGTGHSSLTILTRIPVSEIKIDRSFVSDMTDSTAAAAVVRSVVELGGQMGVRVVATGVETSDQRAALLALGCRTGQGYHFCRLLPPNRIVQALVQLTEAGPARVVPLRADNAS